MKAIITRFILFCAFALMLLPGLSPAQSITVNSVSATSFCAGDPISITFTVAGIWGHNNAFTLQLSDPNGSFANSFTNLGSIKDETTGTFTLSSNIPTTSVFGTNYSLRILGAYPYTTVDTAGFTIGQMPNTYAINGGSGAKVLVGTPVQFTLFIVNHNNNNADRDTIHWDFGDGAVPAIATSTGPDTNFLQSARWATAGMKKIKITAIAAGGCSWSDSTTIFVADTSGNGNVCFPSIPHTAVVDSVDNTDFSNAFDRHWAIWVNSGVTLELHLQYDTVFCEPGATIIDEGGTYGNVIYLKTGASIMSTPGGGDHNTIIYADGASVDLGTELDVTKIHCPNLDFDYTYAPPNKAFPLGVKDDAALAAITLSPNPTTSSILLQHIPAATMSMNILNVLGELVMQIASPHSDNFRIDISKLQSGTYYLRIVCTSGVTTKKIVKE